MDMDKATTTPTYPATIKQELPESFLDINLDSNFSSSSSSSSTKPHSHSNEHVHSQEDDPREESHDSKTSPYMKKEEQVDNSQLICGSHPDSFYNYGGGTDFMALSYGTPKQEESFDSSNQCSSSTLNTSDVLTSDANLSHSVSEAIQHPRQTLSAQEIENILNANLSEGVPIDTKKMAISIDTELKENAIPQSKFAERVLGLRQGTLSDLLRRPTPWEILKSGRRTWIRMHNWMSQPLPIKLAILEVDTSSGVSAEKKRNHRKLESEQEEPVSKKTRHVFTDIQRNSLNAVFKETQRPTQELKKQIAYEFQLKLSTVTNFFQNARRRSRNNVNTDEDDQ